MSIDPGFPNGRRPAAQSLLPVVAPPPSATAGARRVRALSLLLGCSLWGCTAADNLNYTEITTELDGIAAFVGSGPSRQVQYAERAPVAAWYMRSPLTWPLRWPLGLVFGARHEGELENAAGHVRELLVELPDEAAGDLVASSDAFVRLSMFAEVDPGVATQITAMDCLGQLAVRLQLPMFAGAMDSFGLQADPARLAAARAAIRLGRPEQRTPQAWDEARVANYREALATLVERPLPGWPDRLALVGELATLWRLETDRGLQAQVGIVLRTAIAQSFELLLLRKVQGQQGELADVRLAAMQGIRSLGGPRTVPLLLAFMAAPANEVRAGSTRRFDPDPLVQLRLIHLCGQLRGELALQALRLPNRDAWEPIAPAEFLAMTVLNEQDYFSTLRIPALAALALSLGLPRITYEVDWVAQWLKDRQSRS